MTTPAKRPTTATRRIATIAALAVVLVAVFLILPYVYIYGGDRVLGPLKGLYYRTFRAPPLVRANFIEDLDPQRAQAQVEKLLEVYRSGQGSYGLRRTVLSVETTPVLKCLATENGSLTLVIDLTRDKKSTRDFIIVHPSSVGPGPDESSTNAPSPDRAPPGPI